MSIRITGNDSLMTAIIKLADGNPGALAVLTSLAQDGHTIDPDSALGPWSFLIDLDTNNIYADQIWMLYKDVCGENLVYTCAVLRAVQLGLLPLADLNIAIYNRGRGINVIDIFNKVVARLPKFFSTPYKPTNKP